MIDLTAVIDNEEAIRKFRELRNAAKSSFEGIVTESSKVDDAVKGIGSAWDGALSDLKEGITIQKTVIKGLEDQYKQASKALSKAAPGIQKQELARELSGIKKELDAEKESLSLLEAEQRRYSSSLQSIETQIRKVRDEMGRLTLEGKENTAEYKAQEQELQRLGTAYRKIQAAQKALSTGGTQWAGIISGVQGLAGAYAAGQGVASLFVKDTERLMQIQTKLQAVISTLIGLQQVSNTLHETSSFRITTVRKVTELWTGAQTRLTAALGGSTVAANVLMGTLTLGLSVAIGAVIAAISKWNQKQKELKEQQEAAEKANKKYNESVASSSSKIIASYRALQSEWRNTNGSLGRQTEFIKKNEDAFKKLGVQIRSADDAENLFVRNESAFINSIMARARAVAAMELATEQYKKVIENNLNVANLDEKMRKIESDFASGKYDVTSKGSVLRGGAIGGFYVYNESDLVRKKAQDEYRKLSEEKENILKNSRESESIANKLITASADSQKKSTEALMSAGIGIYDSQYEKKANVIKKTQERLAELILANDRALEQSRLDIMKEGREKELAELDMQITEKLQVIEKERKLLNEAYDKDPSSARNEAAQRMTSEFKGNAGLLARPLIDAAELVKKGWEDAGDGIATVFSSQYGILDAEGKEIELLVTPILPNGDVLSPQELEDYIYRQLQGASDILKSDTKKIVIATGVSSDGSAGEILHQLQEAYYSEDIKFKERQINIEQKLVDAKAAINLKYAEEYNKISKQITDSTLSEEERKYQSIKDEYEGFRKWAETAKEGGGITPDQVKELEEKIKQAETTKTLKAIVDEYGTAEDKITEIHEKAEKARQVATENGRSDLIAKITQWEKDQISAIEASVIEQSDLWKQLLGDLDRMTTDQLQEAINQARQLIANSTNLSIQDTQALLGSIENAYKKLTTRNPFKALKDAYDRYHKALKSENKDGVTSAWADVQTATQSVKSNISEITQIASSLGGILGNEVGDGISKVGSLTNDLITVFEGFGGGGASTPGGIMAWVQAGMNVATTIIGLFDDSARQAEIQAEKNRQLEGTWDSINYQVERYIDLLETAGGSEYFENAEKALSSIQKGIDLAIQSLTDFPTGEVDKITGILKVISFAGGRDINPSLLGVSKEDYETLKQVYEVLQSGDKDAIIALKDNEDLFKLLPEWIQQVIDKLIDYDDQLKKAQEDINKDLFQTTTSDMEDAVISWLKNVKDGSDEASEYLEDAMRDALLESFKIEQLRPRLQEFYKKYAQYADTDQDNKLDLTADEISKLREEWKDIIDWSKEQTEGIRDVIGESSSLSAQTASTRGYQVMSQDEGEEMNGRLSDVQAKTGNILAAVEFVKSLSAEQLNRTTDIRDIMIQLNGNVADIRSYTRVLPTMNETLMSMNRKLDNL